MQNKTYQLETLSCPTCARKIEAMLSKTKGVLKAEVLFMSSKVKVSYDEQLIDDQTIAQSIGKLGYAVLSSK